jgi:hypothetical protein
MAKRYLRGNQKPSIEEQTIQWPKDRYLLVIVLSVLRLTASDYLLGIFWSMYCLFFDWRLLITSLVTFGHCIVCSSIDGFWLPLRYLLVIVLSVLRLTASDYLFCIFWSLYCLFFDWRGNQKPSIEGQTIQWPKDTKEVIRSRQSKNKQYKDQKIPKR